MMEHEWSHTESRRTTDAVRSAGFADFAEKKEA